MSYVKQYFESGQKLTAEHMNHIEDGIVAAEQSGGDVKTVNGVAPDENGNVAVELPCYTEQGDLVTVIPENDYAFTDSGDDTGMYAYQIASETQLFDIQVGKKYYLNWDGEQYEFVPQNFEVVEGMVVAGNQSLLDSTLEDTGEPFVFMMMVVDGVYQYGVGTLETDATHNLSLSTYEETVHKLEAKYLPEDAITAMIDAYMEEALGGDY